MIGRTVNFVLYPTTIIDTQALVCSFYENTESNLKYSLKLLKVQTAAEIVMKSFSALYLLAFILPAGSSFLVYLITGKREIISPIFLPFTTLDTHFGFFLNLSLLLVFSIIGFCAFATHDTAFLLNGHHCVAFVDILNEKLCELSKLIEEEAKKGKKNSLGKIATKIIVNQRLEEIIEMHKQYNLFKDLISDFGGMPSFVAIFVNVIAICLSVAGALKVSFVAGFAAAYGYFFQLAIPCAAMLAT